CFARLPAHIGIGVAKPRRLSSGEGTHMIRFSSLARPVALIALGVCCGFSAAAAEPNVKDVLKTYADIAQAGYADSLATAKTMRLAIDQFLSRPTEQNLIAARPAWVAARIPYM